MTSNQGGSNIAFIRGLPIQTRPADAPVFEVTITGTNQPINAGDQIDIDYSVTNTGGLQGTQDIRLDIDGSTEARDADVTLAAGNSTTGTLSYQTGGSETRFTATVWSDNTQDQLDVSTGANFTVTIDSTNSSIDTGETLDVTATIENTGTDGGNEDITLSTAGTTRDTYPGLSLDKDEKQSLTLSWDTQSGDDGRYTAKVESQEDSDTTDVAVVGETSSGVLAASAINNDDGNTRIYNVSDWSVDATLNPWDDWAEPVDANDSYILVGEGGVGGQSAWWFDSDYNQILEMTNAGEDVAGVALGTDFLAFSAFSSQGSGDDSDTYIYDISTESLETSVSGSGSDRADATAILDGEYLAVAYNNIKVWDIPGFSNVENIGADSGGLSVGFSSDYLVFGEVGTSDAYAYTTGTWNQDATLGQAGDSISAIAMNDTYTVTGSYDNAAYVYETGTWNFVTSLSAPTETVDAVGLDSRYLAVGSDDNNVYVYTVNDFNQIPESPLNDASEPVGGASFGL